MDWGLGTWAILAVAVAITGVSKGGFGASVGFVATPLMALAISPVAAAGILLPILILVDHANLIAYWRKWSWAAVWPCCATGVLGIAVGGLAFGEVDTDLLRLALGVISILFTAFLLARARGWAPEGGGSRRLRASLWGTATGFTSTVSHAGGPPVTMYLMGERLDKTVYQASTVLIFWWINLVKLIPYFMVGAIDFGSLETSLILAPAALAGVGLGLFLHSRVSEKAFFSVICVGLFAIGCKLVWDGWAGFMA